VVLAQRGGGGGGGVTRCPLGKEIYFNESQEEAHVYVVELKARGSRANKARRRNLLHYAPKTTGGNTGPIRHRDSMIK